MKKIHIVYKVEEITFFYLYNIKNYMKSFFLKNENVSLIAKLSFLK